MKDAPKNRSSGEKKAVVRRDELAARPLSDQATTPPRAPTDDSKKKSRTNRGAPKSIGELWERVKHSLYATVDGLFGLTVDLVGVTRKVVQKLPEYAPEIIKSALVTPRISEAIAKRIDRADRMEGKAQEKVADGRLTPAVAEDRLQDVLTALHAKGVHVRLLDVQGIPTLIVVRPALAESAEAVAVVGAVPTVLGNTEKKILGALDVTEGVLREAGLEVPPRPGATTK